MTSEGFLLPPPPPLTSYITTVCLSPRREKSDTPLSIKFTLYSSVRRRFCSGVPLQSALSPGHSRIWSPGECKGLSGMSQAATGPVPPSPDARCPETQRQEACETPKSQPTTSRLAFDTQPLPALHIKENRFKNYETLTLPILSNLAVREMV